MGSQSRKFEARMERALCPGTFVRYADGFDFVEELMKLVPAAEKSEWHEKAMVIGERADLDSCIRLFTATKEVQRLAKRLNSASNGSLEAPSHSVTEPAAKLLRKSHPPIAARVHRALAVRILDAKKSKYYGAALNHLAQAHRRKSSFMPGFQRVVAGHPARERKESMVERARKRWER